MNKRNLECIKNNEITIKNPILEKWGATFAIFVVYTRTRLQTNLYRLHIFQHGA